MQDHRIRLNDQDIDLIVTSLRARAAMRKGKGRVQLERLAERLADGGRGNPRWRFDSRPADLLAKMEQAERAVGFGVE